jgi:hypothetical protein
MRGSLLAGASLAAILWATGAKAQDLSPTPTPSAVPCTWNYSFVNGIATASYCGAVSLPTVIQVATPGQWYFGPTGISSIVPITDLQAYGVLPTNSAALNAINLQAAYNAALSGANGGKIHVGCMSVSIGAIVATGKTPTAAIGNNQHLEFEGDGPGCSILNFTGAIDGVAATFANANSTAKVGGMTVTTDQVGATNAQKAFNLSNPNSNGTTYSPQSLVHDVAYNGADFNSASANADYWDSGINETGINNLNVERVSCNGANAAGSLLNHQYTDCLVVQGTGVGGLSSVGAYSVAVNVRGSFFNNCRSAYRVLDWFQGLQVGADNNVTLCTHGLWQSLASPNGALTEFLIHGGQYYNTSDDVDFEDPLVAGGIIMGSQMAVATGTIVKSQGAQVNYTGNNFACNTTNGTIGINLFSGYGQGGTVADNDISGCGKQVDVPNGSNPYVNLSNNHPVGGGYEGLTAAFVGTQATISACTGTHQLEAGVYLQGSVIGSSGTFVVGQQYTILSVGTTNWTTIGAASNTVGLTFTATGTTITGTGTATLSPAPKIGSHTSGSGCNGVYALTVSAGTFSSAAYAQWLNASPYDYVCEGTCGSLKITDVENRLFTEIPPYQAGLAYSTFRQIDIPSGAIAYNQTITAGGGNNDGTVWFSLGLGGLALR